MTSEQQHFYQLLRESYKQGYLAAMEDVGNDTDWNDGEDDFDTWLNQIVETGHIGKLLLLK